MFSPSPVPQELLTTELLCTMLLFHRQEQNVSQPKTKSFIAWNKVCQRLEQLVLKLDTT